MKIEVEIPEPLTLRTLYIKCPHEVQFRGDEPRTQFEVYVSDTSGRHFTSTFGRSPDLQTAINQAAEHLAQYREANPRSPKGDLDLDLSFI